MARSPFVHLIRGGIAEIKEDGGINTRDEDSGAGRGDDGGDDGGEDRGVVELLPKENGGGGGHTLEVMLVHDQRSVVFLGLPDSQSAHKTVPGFGNSACDTRRPRDRL